MIRRLAIVLPVYLVLFVVCWFISFLLRFEFEISSTIASLEVRSLPVVLAVKLIILAFTRQLRRRHRYTTVADLPYVVTGSLAAAMVIYVANLAFREQLGIPRSVILIDAILSILGICLLRLTVRWYTCSLEPGRGTQTKAGALVFGCDHSAVGILRAIHATSTKYRVWALLGEKAVDEKSLIGGVPVIAKWQSLKEVKDRFPVQHLFIPSSVSGRKVRRLCEECREAELEPHVIPTAHELVDGRFQLQIRDVTISDLLRREPAKLDLASIHRCVAKKRILITGAAGSIGSELCRQTLALKPSELMLLDQSESGTFFMEQSLRGRASQETSLHYAIADITDREGLQSILRDFRPQVLFHAAAYKHVPLLEANPREAIRNNVFGTRNVVDLAHQNGVERVVFVSTDKAVRPTNVMGATKLIAEKYLQAVSQNSQTTFLTVRFGNVLDSVGSVVPTFRQQIRAGGPVTVTHPDMVRFFMTIPEAVQLVLQGTTIGSTGDVLILDMGEPVKIVDLAEDMISLSGLRYPEDIDIAFTGIRPGEKLSEELFYECERGAHKVHEKIFCGVRKVITIEDIESDLRRLERAVSTSATQAAADLWSIAERYIALDDQRDVARRVAA